LRSALTTLGIVIGIAAVIAMMEIGQGASTALAKSIESMGTNNVMIFPGAAVTGGVAQGAGTAPTLTPQDVEAIVQSSPDVRCASPIVQTRTQISHGSVNWVPSNIFGTTPDYLTVRDWAALREGETFTERDVRNANRVCLVGATIVKEVFEGASPVGRTLRMQNVPFRVIGVLARKGANMVGMDQDDIVLAPWTTIKYRVSGAALGQVNQSAAGSASSSDLYPRTTIPLYPQFTESQLANSPRPTRSTTVDQITLKASSTAAIPRVIAGVESLLRERHHISAGETDDFNLRDMTELTRMFGTTTNLMMNLLLSVALISLVVGGVGIMNIMLVSVTERTREIGLRMAVGAKQRDILAQFLVESILLCLGGGALGVAGGRMISFLVATLLGWPIAASPEAIAAAVGVSVLIGLSFGFYPAWKASRLDPIDALRYE